MNMLLLFFQPLFLGKGVKNSNLVDFIIKQVLKRKTQSRPNPAKLYITSLIETHYSVSINDHLEVVYMCVEKISE